VKPTTQLKSDTSILRQAQHNAVLRAGVNVNDDVGLEKEADVMGAKASQNYVSQSVTIQRVSNSNGETIQMNNELLKNLALEIGVAATLSAVAAYFGVNKYYLSAALAMFAATGLKIGGFFQWFKSQNEMPSKGEERVEPDTQPIAVQNAEPLAEPEPEPEVDLLAEPEAEPEVDLVDEPEAELEAEPIADHVDEPEDLLVGEPEAELEAEPVEEEVAQNVPEDVPVIVEAVDAPLLPIVQQGPPQPLEDTNLAIAALQQEINTVEAMRRSTAQKTRARRRNRVINLKAAQEELRAGGAINDLNFMARTIAIAPIDRRDAIAQLIALTNDGTTQVPVASMEQLFIDSHLSVGGYSRDYSTTSEQGTGFGAEYDLPGVPWLVHCHVTTAGTVITAVSIKYESKRLDDDPSAYLTPAIVIGSAFGIMLQQQINRQSFTPRAIYVRWYRNTHYGQEPPEL
jgi:hypothetical protein